MHRSVCLWHPHKHAGEICALLCYVSFFRSTLLLWLSFSAPESVCFSHVGEKITQMWAFHIWCPCFSRFVFTKPNLLQANRTQSPQFLWKSAGLSTDCKVAVKQEKSPGEQEVMRVMFLAAATRVWNKEKICKLAGQALTSLTKFKLQYFCIKNSLFSTKKC